MKLTEQMNLRLDPKVAEALAVLAARWGLSKSDAIRTMAIQLARREDITSPLRIGEQAAGHIDTLIAIRAELDRVIKATVTR